MNKRTRVALTSLLLGASVGSGAGCSDDSVRPLDEQGKEPPLARNLTLVSGDNQVGRPGEPLPQPLVVKVTGVSGRGIEGVEVDWAITRGDGTVATGFQLGSGDPVRETSTYTDARGRTHVPLMQLGFENLEIQAQTHTSGVSVVTFHVGAADPGASLAVVSGSDQPARAGQPLEEPFVMRVTDVRGEPIPYVRVAWAVESGEGAFGLDELGNCLLSDTTRTDVDGLARALLTPTWFGPVTVSASLVGTEASPLVFATDATDLGAGLSIVSGSEQDGKAGAVLADPLVVLVTDALGSPTPNVLVRWSGVHGEGVFGDYGAVEDLEQGAVYTEEGAAYTDEQGLARVSFSPMSLGSVGVEARLEGPGSTATFTAKVNVLVIHYTWVWLGGWGFDDVTCSRRDESGWCAESAVPLGTRVEWVNRSCCAQLVSTSWPLNGASFDSGTLSVGQRFEFVPGVVASGSTWPTREE